MFSNTIMILRWYLCDTLAKTWIKTMLLFSFFIPFFLAWISVFIFALNNRKEKADWKRMRLTWLPSQSASPNKQSFFSALYANGHPNNRVCRSDLTTSSCLTYLHCVCIVCNGQGRRRRAGSSGFLTSNCESECEFAVVSKSWRPTLECLFVALGEWGIERGGRLSWSSRLAGQRKRHEDSLWISLHM